jgi:hypothetical protein
MCKEIEIIKNVSVFANLGSSSDFTVALNLSGNYNACVIRTISYAGTNTDLPDTYLIWADIANNYVGSFSVGGTTTASTTVYNNTCIAPQTMIYFKQLHSSNQIRFRVDKVIAGVQQSNPNSAGNYITGNLAITMDFIRYSSN